MSLFSIFNPAKDFLLEAALKLWFNQHLKQYGHMTRIQIDSKNKTIGIELDLLGETTPLRIDVTSYRLTSEGDETFVELGNVETSREWINALLAEYLKAPSRRIKVPAAVKVVL